MRKKPAIRMKSKETAAEVFELFLLTKRADGVKPRTIETYKQHFHAISKHLDINQEIAEMTTTDLKKDSINAGQRTCTELNKELYNHPKSLFILV